MHRILDYIEKNAAKIESFPWQGMKLIITRDNCTQTPIDYIEHSIRIDCSNVPNEWMYIFTQITQSRLQLMQDVQAQIRVLEKNFLAIFEHYFTSVVTRQSPTNTLNKRVPHYQIRLQKGFTCSERMYGYFLLTMNTFKTVITPNTSSTTTTNATFSDDVMHSREQELTTKPIIIDVIIEENHGTKVLPRTGQFRVDAKATGSQILALLEQEAITALQTITQYQAEQDRWARYQEEIVTVLGITILDKMAGIDEAKFVHALEGIHQYLEAKNGSLSRLVMMMTHEKAMDGQSQAKNKCNRGIFRHLVGMKVMIGYYCGIRDDGACILPWNIPFQKLS